MPRMYKDILMDYRRMEEVSTFPNRLYCLSETTVQMILALSESFYWHTRWQMPPEESPHDWTTSEAAQIKEWAARLEREFLTPQADCDSPVNCLDCIDYPPTSARIEWSPQDPFTQPDLVPSGWAVPPLFVVEVGAVIDAVGAQVGDVLTTFDRFAFVDPSSYDREYPHFRVNWNGPAEVEIHLVGVPQGGLAVIQLDGGQIDIIETSSISVVDFDSLLAGLLSVVGISVNELFPEIIAEVKSTTAGDHHVDVTFYPTVSLEEFVGWGGGLRKITICGEIGIEECPDDVPTQIRLNPENTCVIQVSYDEGETWEDAVDLDNTCGPDVKRIRQNPEFPCHIEFSNTREGEETWAVGADLRLCQPTLRWRGGILEWFDGDEWIPFELIDPLYDDPPPPIPRPEEEPNDPRCSAAASAAYAYVDLANRLYGLLNVTPAPFPHSVAADYAGVVSNTLNFFMGTDAFNNLVTNLVFQVNVLSYISDLMLGMGGAAAELISVLDLTNPDMRDKIKCALYCAMSSTGVVSSADAFAAIDDAIDNDGLASGWSRFIELFGAGGVNAASSVGAFSVPADDCDCDCPEPTNCYDVSPFQESFGIFAPADGFCFSDIDVCRTIDGSGMYCSASSANSMIWYCTMLNSWGTVGAGAKLVTITFDPPDDLIAVGWASDSTMSDAVWLTFANETEVEIPAGKLLIIRVRCSSAKVTRLCAYDVEV